MSQKLNLKSAYENWVAQARARTSHDRAMKLAIGGEFEAYGVVEMEMLRFYGLPPKGFLVDVGCGSGRLAIPLSRSHEGDYVGTDLVADLVDYAREKAERPDWAFEVVDGLTIPVADAVADMVCFFSVFTHLLHEQTYLYLEEARRVLKPGGRIVFSFLEFAMAFHWNVFAGTVEDERRDGQHPLNVFLDRHAIRAFADHLGLRVVDIRNGDEPFVPLREPLTLADGRRLEQFGNLGQSICVLER